MFALNLRIRHNGEIHLTATPMSHITWGEQLNTSPAHLAFLLLLLAVVVLFSTLIGAAAVVIARIDGASYPAALVRGAVAFTGSATLSLVLLSLLLTAL